MHPFTKAIAAPRGDESGWQVSAGKDGMGEYSKYVGYLEYVAYVECVEYSGYVGNVGNVEYAGSAEWTAGGYQVRIPGGGILTW